MDRLYRSGTDRMIAGVCGGLGRYLGIDPLIVRIAFVALAMMTGIGVTVYVLLWILVPVSQGGAQLQIGAWPNTNATVSDRVHDPGAEMRRVADESTDGGLHRKRADLLLLVGAVLVGLGVLALLDNVGWLWWFSVRRLWPLLLIALGSVLLLNRLRERP